MFYIQLFKCVCHILRNTLGTCFIPNFPREINGLGYVRSGASKSGPSTSATSTRPSPTSGYVIFSKTYMSHVLYPIFQEKSTGNGLRYVRGLQVMPIDVDNVNQAKYHKWVLHILKNMHGTFFIPNFSREVDY